jgi:hypothetical protein
VLLNVVRGDAALQMIEPQYFWGVMFFVAALLLAGTWRTKMRKR